LPFKPWYTSAAASPDGLDKSIGAAKFALLVLVVDSAYAWLPCERRDHTFLMKAMFCWSEPARNQLRLTLAFPR
jgi:hypothetical protein